MNGPRLWHSGAIPEPQSVTSDTQAAYQCIMMPYRFTQVLGEPFNPATVLLVIVILN